ncbi:hemicentin-1 isoform X2 [Eurytemora carolleeae]|uniref:hemicentin-1 isoform X2 n=1 Tax=Eurytemora carolleeae TaxID=1294199 RepID=UPI000C76DAC9|nr:hemicentin-1 isoform X2 [Eurytemora carolleeae]|eukprot:XP_023345438.1 hemicentin-1-like isoform X2 [Eurytemora affinis]
MHLNWKSGILIIYWLSTKYSDGASDALYQTVEAIQGGIAELPCSLEDKEDGDSVYLVLWYRREDRTPIYSYDSRSPRVGGLPDLWSEPSVFGERGTFHPHLVGTPAVLSVKNISKTFDEGDYTCRVDFRQSPTKYHRVRLRVIVPPGQPVLTNTNGDPINDMVGPFREGDTITLECTVKGGIPAPRVHWYRDNILLDDSDQVAQGKSMRNSLTILHFHREHLNSRFRCICFNNNLTVPSEASTRINMIFPPLGVRISSEISPFSVGKQYIIRCISWGSNPPAHLELNWKTGLKVPPGPGAERGVLKPLNITREWNSTKATVIYRPVLTDSGSELACTAVNSEVKPTALIQDSIRLQVYYPPTVRLEIGKAINLEDLEEGDDVYFECSVEANPPPYKVTWLHNDVEILPRGSGNVIMSNHSLVLQKVQREQGGEYRCHASNVEGDGHSEPIQLNVMYAPVCKDRKDRVYGVSENETLLVECLVDAYPSAVSFSWFFNNSLTSTLLNKDLFSSSPGHSVLSYTPHSHMDFGSLLCWADNMVGNQKHTRPCIFHIIPTGPPESPGECRSINQTETQIMVQCRLGYSGGLPQHIHLEIYSSSGYILANMSGI